MCVRRHIASVCSVVVCLAAAAASIADASIVPATVQRAIPKKVPAHLRYIPTGTYQPSCRSAIAMRNGTGRALASRSTSLVRAGRRRSSSLRREPAGRVQLVDHTYRFGSVRVFFEKDRYDEQFWRCVRVGTVSIEATIRRADDVTAAKRRAIAAMVASATRFG